MTFEEVEPCGVCRAVDVEIERDAEEKFVLHAVDLGERDARHVRPGLVRVSVAARCLSTTCF